jgi:hypothetical protein
VVAAAQLSALEQSDGSDGGGLIPDDILDALQHHAYATEADCHISMYAISGAATNRAIHLRALIGNQNLSILVDSGSSHTFLNSSMLDKISHKAVPAPPLRVKVANGQVIMSEEKVSGLEWWI